MYLVLDKELLKGKQDPDLKIMEKSDPDPKQIVSNPQH
jgi:hypothetical protein